MFRFFCPLCGNKLKATREMIGSDVQCAHCSKVIAVPEPDNRDTAEIIRPKPQPPQGWAKTQEISRSALRNRANGDESINLVDLINEQVDMDTALDFEKDTEKSVPEPPSEPAPQKVAVPVDMSKVSSNDLTDPEKVAVAVTTADPPDDEATAPQKVATPVEMPRADEQETEVEDMPEPPPPPPPHREPSKYRAGMRLGNFEIGRLLGEGAMGQVFAAKQISMDREVALKILPPETLQQDAAAAEQFRNEIKMLAKLDHQNIVTAFEAGEDDGVYYLAMAFINGNSLEELLEDGSVVEEEQSLSVILSVAIALEYAWDTFNMLHQDIKPANIMLDERGDVKLMDMGIATMASKESSGQTDAFVLGTPHYMSPEQTTGQSDLDWRSDQYSLGCTLYRMVTGEVPFPGDDPAEVMKAHLSTPLTPAKTKNPDLSQDVNDLLKRMLAKTRDRRFQTTTELIDALKQAIQSVRRQQKKTPKSGGRKGPAKKRPPRRLRRGGGYVAKPTGASGGQFLLGIFAIVFGIYLFASIVNKSSVLMKMGLTFPQQIFLPIFRNDPPE